MRLCDTELIVKFLLTMNMPSANNNLVHQIICEYPVDSLSDLMEEFNDNEFIICTQFYREVNRATGQQMWFERGEIVLNTSAIGKAQVFFERD